MKQIKIENDAHKTLAEYCPKAKTYGQCIGELLEGHPFVARLEDVLPRTVERIEKAKKEGSADVSMADDLVRVCQWIIDTCKQRSGKR